MTPDRERLAAEHVIGLLEGEDRREAERLLASDASFRDAVARWQSRFSELDGTATALAPAEDLWQRIEAGLGPTVAARAPSSQRLVFADARAAFRSLWRSLAFWQIAGIAGAFASMLLAIGLAVVADQRAKQPVLVAVLFMDANRPGAVVNTFANGGAELVPLEAIAVPAGRALQVWTLWDRTRGPVSVGLIDSARTIRLDLENLPTPTPNQLFEITLEPASGSPTGRPTGPVLMKGNAATAL